MDLGIEPYLVSSTLVGIVAQRMVRRLCSHCITPSQASIEEPMAYEGPVRHWIGHDEPPPRWALTANMSRQITVGTNLSFALTPIGYENWLYTLLENDSQGRCFSIRADIEDNPYIPREADGSIGVAKDIENAPIDEAEKAARLHGEWTSIAGRIWKEYGDHNFVDVRDVPREYTRWIIVDSHPDKDDYVNLVAWDETNRRMFVMAEGRFPGQIKDRCLSIRQFAQGEYVDLMAFDPSTVFIIFRIRDCTFFIHAR